MVAAEGYESLRRLLVKTWSQRHAIEVEAAARFKALSARLAEVRAPGGVVALAELAAGDELRHAAHCQRFATRYGGPRLPQVLALVEYAPPRLSWAERLLYEVVAQSCVAETQSTATLATLLEAAETPGLREALQELARDEVNHARMGWAYLAWVRERMDVSFLSPLLPSMIEASAGPELFERGPAEANAAELLRHGILPQAMRRELYWEMLETVVLPGLAQNGVDTGAARAWLERRRGQPQVCPSSGVSAPSTPARG